MRLALSFCAAMVVTLMLFWLMQTLVTAATAPPAAPVTPIALERVLLPPDAPPPPKNKPLPAPVSEQARPPSSTAAAPRLSLPAAAVPSVNLPGVNVAVNLSGRPQTGNALSGRVSTGAAMVGDASGEGGFTGTDLVPMASARPKYPRSAADAGLEGWVELIFVIQGDGTVTNVRVLDASPRGIFEDAAVHAMQKWVYVPYYERGKAVAREATQLFEFRREHISPLYIWEDGGQ